MESVKFSVENTTALKQITPHPKSCLRRNEPCHTDTSPIHNGNGRLWCLSILQPPNQGAIHLAAMVARPETYPENSLESASSRGRTCLARLSLSRHPYRAPTCRPVSRQPQPSKQPQVHAYRESQKRVGTCAVPWAFDEVSDQSLTQSAGEIAEQPSSWEDVERNAPRWQEPMPPRLKKHTD